MRPWSHTIHLSWRPELTFFERRTDFLRSLEQENLLQAFRWADPVVSAMIGAEAEVDLWSGGMTARIRGPQGDIDLCRKALQIGIETVSPGPTAFDALLLQFLYPLPLPYEEALRTTSMNLVAGLLGPARPLDWAYLVDGQSGHTEATFQVEFGVIDRSEAADRLGRTYGRIQDTHRSDTPVRVAQSREVPAVAFFFDFRWVPKRIFETELLTSLISVWDGIVRESEEISEAIVRASGVTDRAVTREEAGG